MVKTMTYLINDTDLISSAHTILQVESKKTCVDIQWIRNYLGQEDADDAAIDVVATAKSSKTFSTVFPFQSPPPVSNEEHLFSDEDGHEDLSDIED